MFFMASSLAPEASGAPCYEGNKISTNTNYRLIDAVYTSVFAIKSIT